MLLLSQRLDGVVYLSGTGTSPSLIRELAGSGPVVLVDERISGLVERAGEVLSSTAAILESLDLRRNGNGLGPTPGEGAGALEEELLSLRERSNIDLELAQLGMAVEVISHEFGGTVRSMRRNLRRLKAWADVNADLEPVYTDLRTSFEHLDGYLNLFTPLQRRLRRTKSRFRGTEIHRFLEELFDERLAKDLALLHI